MAIVAGDMVKFLAEYEGETIQPSVQLIGEVVEVIDTRVYVRVRFLTDPTHAMLQNATEVVFRLALARVKKV